MNNKGLGIKNVANVFRQTIFKHIPQFPLSRLVNRFGSTGCTVFLLIMLLVFTPILEAFGPITSIDVSITTSDVFLTTSEAHVFLLASYTPLAYN